MTLYIERLVFPEASPQNTKISHSVTLRGPHPGQSRASVIPVAAIRNYWTEPLVEKAEGGEPGGCDAYCPFVCFA